MNASIQTYLLQIASGKIHCIKDKIVSYTMKNPDCTIDDMKRDIWIITEQGKLKTIKHQTLSARLSELLNDGILFISDTIDKSDSDRVLSKFRIETDNAKAETNKNTRRNEKFRKWIKKGLNDFSDLLENSTIDELYNYKMEDV